MIQGTGINNVTHGSLKSPFNDLSVPIMPVRVFLLFVRL